MTATQRANHLSKVHSFSLSENSLSTGISTSLQLSDGSKLSADSQTAVKGMNVPISCIEGIWRKATDLKGNHSAIVAAPGHNSDARLQWEGPTLSYPQERREVQL